MDKNRNGIKNTYSLLQISKDKVEQTLSNLFRENFLHKTSLGKKLTEHNAIQIKAWIALDGTCGNGHDTAFLAATLNNLCMRYPPARYTVLGLDIQVKAVEETKRRLHALNLHQHVLLAHADHAHLNRFIRPDSHLAIAMYNLGYLPGSDKTIRTQSANTLASLEQAAAALLPHGLLCVHAYAGHLGGKTETETVNQWFSSLPYTEWNVLSIAACNKSTHHETLFLAWKVGSPLNDDDEK